MINRYVFDLDNTLIYTNLLNSRSYNYALVELGLLPIRDCVRVTRKVVLEHYPFLNKYQQTALTQLKQDYFLRHIHATKPNLDLLFMLRSHGHEFCVLWTSAEKERVLSLLEHYQLQSAFAEIIYSSKENIRKDIKKICTLFSCTSEQLVFFEDNADVIEKLKACNQVVIQTSIF